MALTAGPVDTARAVSLAGRRLAPHSIALTLITAAAGLSYAWALNDVVLEPYYAAAVRTMASSWRHFAFGAFDPAATITVDKLPGALWVQALSVRIFGWHTWSLVLPQVVEGIAAVLVLYRAVRRLAGPGAATIAALVLALSPAVVGLNRANIPDTLMILLLVLAADAAAAAAVSGRQRGLLLAAVWVGLAFHTKMLEAWVLAPGLALTYALAAPVPLGLDAGSGGEVATTRCRVRRSSRWHRRVRGVVAPHIRRRPADLARGRRRRARRRGGCGAAHLDVAQGR